MPPTPDAGGLAATLAALPLDVETVACDVALVSVPSYPDGARPSGVVRLGGSGAEGAGEHVAWTLDAQEALRARLATLAPRGRRRLGEWSAEVAARTRDPYVRAALEAAAIDLALRQRRTSLLALAGVPSCAVRYVVSFACLPVSAGEAARLRATSPAVELKIDVDPAWPDDVWVALAALEGVSVLDCKQAGTAADAERAHHALPAALIEDPGGSEASWSSALRERVSFDARIVCAADLETLPLRPAAVNVKPARLGGVLGALRTIARCQARTIPVYMGGMFEVGPGRRQLQALAALFSPDGPNDVAPIGVGGAPAPRPRTLAVDAARPGFGAETA